MESNWLKAIEFVLSHEAYHSDHPNDPGGLTIWGISVKYHPEDVKKMSAMPMAEARTYAEGIYRKQYWLPQECDILPWPYDILLFDCSVNPGPGWASKAFQELGKKQNAQWEDFLFGVGGRVRYYAARKPEWRKNFMTGVVNRTLDLYDMITREGI